jgi:D-alanyl-D-alanine dipeptidase
LSILIIFFILYDSTLFIENGKGSSLKEEEISTFTNVNKVVKAGGQDKTTASIKVIPNTPISNTPIPNTSITNIPITKAPITITLISNIPTPTIKSKEKIKEVKSLVELIELDNSFVIDIKYATKDNFTKKVIYPSAKCIINKNTAAKLIKANNEFKKIGYRIKIYDAYRPHSAQKILWDAASDKSFVADPKNGSNHNRGAAVDLTLVDKYGKEVSMPSGYDEFTKRAKLDYKDCPKEKINNRELLGKIMVKCGFKRIKSEWWHFDDTDAKKYPVLDIPFISF